MNMLGTPDKRRLPLDSYPPRMRVDQVASYLNCSEDHVLKLVKLRALPAVNLSGSNHSCAYFRINRSDLAAFVQKRKL